MCIFTGRVDVQGTNIFVAHSNKGTRQVTIYENIVHIKKNGKKQKTTTSQAMILPVPLNSGEKVELIDLSLEPEFFTECENCFRSNTKQKRNRVSYKGVHLEVKQVGGYKCSIAENIDDILKINPDVFTLPEDIHELLSKHYSKGFAFVCCLFDSNILKTHPIGFVHSVIGKNQLFVPTRHEHGSELSVIGKNQLFVPTRHEHGSELSGDKKNTVKTVKYHQYYIHRKHDTLPNKGDVDTNDFATWDHVIYSVNSDVMQGGAKTSENPKRNIEDVISKIPVKGIDDGKKFHRLKINGTVENVDVILECF
eukprot:gene11717-5056_t